jgi:hypothetical protein
MEAHTGFIWRDEVDFIATCFALGAGSFVPPSKHKVLGHSLS